MHHHRYVIMDQRAYSDVDRVTILSIQDCGETLNDLRQERDASWPGCPIVALDTWTILDEED